MKKFLVFAALLLTGLVAWQTPAMAQTTGAHPHEDLSDPLSSSPNDPDDLLRDIQEQDAERQAVIPISPLGGFRDRIIGAKQSIYTTTGIDLGFDLTNLGQGLSNALPFDARSGTVTDFGIVAKRNLINKGRPNHGSLYVQLEGKWDYGTTGPEDLGFVSLASAGGTADNFAASVPTFIMNNLFWQHGSKAAGWAYRFGKITPDGILLTSSHLDSSTTFLPNVGVGIRADAFPDSGLGWTGGLFPNDRVAVTGLISDANGNEDWGDIGAGDTYKAVELSVKIFPKTPGAGYSKFDLWHTDGTKNGQQRNANTGREGWGFGLKLEQELTSDGTAIAIFRYGRGYNRAAIYKQQAGLSFLLYEPAVLIRLENDLFGVAFNWVESSTSGTRDEYNFEAFYRFPIFPAVDATFSYQSVIDPAFTTFIDHASAFSFRLRTTY